MKTLKEYWDESRGNFVGTILAAALVAVISWVTGWAAFSWRWFSSLPLPIRALSVALFLSTVGLAIMTTLWYRARRRTVVFHIGGKEQIPEFLIPRAAESSGSGARRDKSVGTTPEKPPHPIVVHFMTDGTPIKGLVAQLENIGLQPLEGCRLILKSIGSYHPGHGSFRTPTFGETVIFPPRRMEPEGPKRLTNCEWIIRPRDAGHMQVEIPAGTNQEWRQVNEPTVWKAVFRVMYGQTEYEQGECFTWTPGQPPQVEDSAIYGF